MIINYKQVFNEGMIDNFSYAINESLDAEIELNKCRVYENSDNIDFCRQYIQNLEVLKCAKVKLTECLDLLKKNI